MQFFLSHEIRKFNWEKLGSELDFSMQNGMSFLIETRRVIGLRLGNLTLKKLQLNAHLTLSDFNQ